MKVYIIIIVISELFINYLFVRNIIYLWLSKKDKFYLKSVHFKSISRLTAAENNDFLDYIIKKAGKSTVYKNAKRNITRAGYYGKYVTVKYLLILFGIPFVVATIGCIINYPNILNSVTCAGLIVVLIKIFIKSKQKKITAKFERNAWRIYRYLHNQVTAGIKITDAITTAYRVANDKDINKILTKFAASFKLTMDIENALDEITQRFGGNEAATLCMAIREGVKTGDSSNMLKRQEDVMFNKYFNRLQAQTEKSRTKCIFSAALFCSIIILMTGIPIVLDVLNALDSIF